MAEPSACDARHPKLWTNTFFTRSYQSKCHTWRGLRDWATTGHFGVERKVRSSQGSMPANGRGFALKVHATDQCHRKYTACRFPASKGEKVR